MEGRRLRSERRDGNARCGVWSQGYDGKYAYVDHFIDGKNIWNKRKKERERESMGERRRAKNKNKRGKYKSKKQIHLFLILNIED